jgi:HK97 family phage major capsid protein
MNTNTPDRTMQRKNAGQRSDDQLELKQLTDSLERRDTEIKGWCEKATAEIKNLGKVTTETTAALMKLSEGGVELQDRLLEVEQKLARRGNQDSAIIKSVGTMFSESESFKTLVEKGGRGTARMSLKAVTSINSGTAGTGGVGSAIRPDRLEGINAPPQREFTIRDLIMPGRTGSNSVEYVRESGFQNMADSVAEGARRTQSDLSFDLVMAPVRTIAHFFKASRQVLDDIPLLQSYIDGRARYGLKYAEEEKLLGGDGVGQNILGLIPQASTFNDALRKTGDTRIDTLRRAILQCRIAEYRPSAVVLNPMDWAEIELQKDDTGQYIWVNVGTGAEPMLWRLPIIDTNAMPDGHFMVGAYNMAAQVFDREEANVEVSTEDGDNFKEGMVTIRAEERLALAVHRPQSFVYGPFAKP